MTDKQILAGLQQREEDTIAWVMRKYTRLLWGIADAVLKNVGSQQDTEECVADVFILLWLAPEKFNPDRGSLKSWLCIKARCRAIDRYRELTRHDTVSLDDAMVVGRMGLQEALLKQEQRQELAAAVHMLEPLECEILLRRYFYEQKPAGIAIAMDLPLKKVNNCLYHTKRKLRKAIEA